MTNMNDLFTEFEKADYPTRISLFRKALTSGEMDGEWALDLLNELFFAAAANDDRETFNNLIIELRDKVPQAYESEAADLLNWQITNDLVDGRPAHLPTHLEELAQSAGESPDIVSEMADRLAYYGKLDLLVQLYERAWEPLQAGEDIEDWEIEEFAVNAVNAIILRYLETAADPRADDSLLLQQLDPFAEFDAAALAAHMTQITGRDQREWRPDDFLLPRKKVKEIPKSIDQNLTYLLRHFVHYLHTTTDTPVSRAALAYWPLAEVLENQIEIDMQQYRPKRKKQSKYPRKKTTASSHLYPNKLTLAEYLSRQLDTLTPQHYRGAALMAALPAWFQFLRAGRLIDAVQEKKARQQVTPLLPELRDFWADHPDPAVPASLAVWGN